MGYCPHCQRSTTCHALETITSLTPIHILPLCDVLMSLFLLPQRHNLGPIWKRPRRLLHANSQIKKTRQRSQMDVNNQHHIYRTLHIVHAKPKDLMRLANGNGPRYGHSPGTPVADLLVQDITNFIFAMGVPFTSHTCPLTRSAAPWHSSTTGSLMISVMIS